jgi:CMP-N-acetylneuraminic acid synthetase
MQNNSVKIICLIPARQGSVGLRKKNLRFLGFSTLVHRAIKVAKRLRNPKIIVLSTDDKTIIKRYTKKVDFCIERSPELSSSSAHISDVILDTLNRIPQLKGDDLLILLEPSSPNRNLTEISDAIETVIKYNYKSLITVSKLEPKYHPFN